jgi:hypothetical protein
MIIELPIYEWAVFLMSTSINHFFVIPASEPESRLKNKDIDSGSETGMTT